MTMATAKRKLLQDGIAVRAQVTPVTKAGKRKIPEEDGLISYAFRGVFEQTLPSEGKLESLSRPWRSPPRTEVRRSGERENTVAV